MPSIYDPPHVPPEEPRQPSALELAIRDLRHSLTASAASLNESLSAAKDTIVTTETKMTSSVGSWFYPAEATFENLGFVPLAFFTGTIVTRNAPLYAKLMLPVVFAGAAFVTVAPITCKNARIRMASALSSIFNKD